MRDVSLPRAREILALSRRAEQDGLVVSVISQHRFDPASRVVADAAHSGGFGRLTSGIASVAWWRSQEYYDSGQWRGTWEIDGGGAVMNQGVHTVDLLVWMLGSYALYRRPLKRRVPWPTAAQWAGGVIGVVAIASVLTLVWAEVNWDEGMPATVYLGLMALLLLATMGYSARLTYVGTAARRRSAGDSIPNTGDEAESLAPAAPAGDG